MGLALKDVIPFILSSDLLTNTETKCICVLCDYVTMQSDCLHASTIALSIHSARLDQNFKNEFSVAAYQYIGLRAPSASFALSNPLILPVTLHDLA